MATPTHKNRATPGVYITEFPAFPPSVVGVETAIPIFVGYTETARDPSSHNPLYMQPVRIESLADYISYFGNGPAIQYCVTEVASDSGEFDFQLARENNQTTNYAIQPVDNSQFNLFVAIRLFYANGGGTCFVVSVANYQGKQDVVTHGNAIAVDAKFLGEGIKQAEQAIGPTMIVVPDACLLAKTKDSNSDIDITEYKTVVDAMIGQAALLQNRVAILDLPAALDPKTWTKEGLAKARDAFYTAIEAQSGNFSYAAAYAPALDVSVLGPNDVKYTNLLNDVKKCNNDGVSNKETVNDILKEHAKTIYRDTNVPTELSSAIDLAFPPASSADSKDKKDSEIISRNNYLVNALPLLRRMLEILLSKLNVAPPSGVMAGLWATNDATRGVWNAPANMAPACVIKPKIFLNDSDQSDYNVPLNGKAICLLRSFPGRGTLVWGARTLDGNSNDYRYIQVRRTLIYIEQSIKAAIQPFVFAANDGRTWVTVTSLISNFLTDLWTRGGLMGDKPSDAFSVQCGLGSTMTAQDILNGYMIVSVRLQMIHPAEFIELTFTQMMQGA